MLRTLDLFSGIGGFSLGLERTGGFQTVAFCEIEPFCRRVLSKHWPGVPIYEDVRQLSADTLRRDGIAVDVICGGFPCQDISTAGRRAGLEGARSGLWSEYARLIGEIRPRFVIVENVPGLLSLGMATVLGELSEIGYDAVWDCIPASACGAPHRRDRVWIVAYSSSARRRQNAGGASGHEGAHEGRTTEDHHQPGCNGESDDTRVVADANTGNVNGRRGALQMGRQRVSGETAHYGDSGRAQWSPEPDVGRVAHGVSNRVDRLGGLGNAVVPQVVEAIGRAILALD
jgi:DNA (cytosine-5)-methyltransferase 1